MPILMHADNIEWADRMTQWVRDPKNKSMSKAGDDRTPPWRWQGSLNTDGERITLPSEYIMRCLMEGAAQVSTGNGKTTFKARSQSGMFCQEFHWPLIIRDKTILMSQIKDICALETFAEQAKAAQETGFSLFVKRAKIGTSKHIRVRPRFDNWSTVGIIIVVDDLITTAVLEQILEVSGRYKGLGDWRPGAKTPGPFGTFSATVVQVKD